MISVKPAFAARSSARRLHSTGLTAAMFQCREVSCFDSIVKSLFGICNCVLHVYIVHLQAFAAVAVATSDLSEDSLQHADCVNC